MFNKTKDTLDLAKALWIEVLDAHGQNNNNKTDALLSFQGDYPWFLPQGHSFYLLS